MTSEDWTVAHSEAQAAAELIAASEQQRRHAAIAAAGGLLGALGAASCCVLPLVLFMLGVGGVWIGALTALEPYQPLFVAVAVGFLGYGYWLVYRRPKTACTDGEACARPVPGFFVRTSLWTATMLVAAAIAFPYVAPLLLGA